MMGSTIFSGTSRYSQDLQQVIQRSLRIAALPLTQLRQQKLELTDRQSALNELQTQFTSLTTSLEKLSDAVLSGSVSAESSQPGVAQATITGTALPGLFEVEVLSMGSFSSTVSSGTPRVTSPGSEGISSASTLTLTVNGQDFTIQPSDQSLSSLVAAINSSDAGVDANIVNLGSPEAPDYRLMVQGRSLGPTTIGLSDGSTELLSTLSTGSMARYTVNGQPPGGISSGSRTVTLAPGLTMDLRGTGTASVSVSQTPGLLSEPLAEFVKAFNTAVDEVDKHRGQAGGALSGEAILSSLMSTLSSIGTYRVPGQADLSLQKLGISFDSTGHLQINSSVVASMSQAEFRSSAAFLGGVLTGGFLKSAADALDKVTNTTSGIIDASLDSVQSSIRNSESLIEANERRVSDLQINLEQRMAAADALIATLEQQVKYFDALFESMQSNSGN